MSSPMVDPKAKQRLVQEWQAVLKQALDADTWGQALEAVDEYEKLTRILDEQIPTLQLTNDERSSLLKLRYCTNLRATSLQDLNNLNHAIKLEDCKLLPKVLENVFIKPIEFPITLDNYNYALENKGAEEPTIQGDQPVEEKTGGSLLPPAKVKAGLTTIELFIDKIGLKDAQSYIQSHLTILVVDSTGKEILETQTTPNTNKLKPNYVTFGETIHIQTPLEEIAKGYVIFFEFKHYKPKKKKISTRCFALLEYDELLKAKGTTVCLELYKKPTDLTRKKINLFTIKPLYLHVRVVFNKH